MGDMLADAADWLADVQKEHVSGTVRYVRGDNEITDDLVVTVGRTEFEQEDASGRVFRSESADWIVATEDFDALGVGEPLRDDIVFDDRVTGKRLIYRVVAPGAEPPWRYADRHRKQMRIHSTLVGEEARA